jgi:hypothetical protein
VKEKSLPLKASASMASYSSSPNGTSFGILPLARGLGGSNAASSSSRSYYRKRRYSYLYSARSLAINLSVAYLYRTVKLK